MLLLPRAFMTVFAVISYSISAASSQEEDCVAWGPSWIFYSGNCYFVSTKSNDWHEASNICSRNNSVLASILSEEENIFLRENGTTKSTTWLLYGYWIGLNALDEKGSFLWLDRKPFDYHNFTDNTVLKSPHSELCVAIDNKGSWSIAHCSDTKQYICKSIDKTSTATPGTTLSYESCEESWTAYDNRCFRPYSEPALDRTSARDFCKEKGGWLLSIHSDEEQAMATYLLGLIRTSAWIGFRKVGHKKHIWDDNSRMDFTYWGHGEPISLFASVTNCVEMRTEVIPQGRWFTQSCDKKRGYICQKHRNSDPKESSTITLDVSCIKDMNVESIRYRDACYFRDQERRLSWNESEYFCQKLGGHLVSMADYYEFSFLTIYLRDLTENMWIGLSDTFVQSENSFHWSDKWPVAFTEWDSDQPHRKQPSSGGRCVIRRPNNKWAVENCDNQNLTYLCKTSSIEPPDVKAYEDICPESWLDLESTNCFMIDSMNSPVKKEKAEEICREKDENAILGIFHSQRELNNLHELLSDTPATYWIGMTRDIFGTYVWKDGSPVDFVKWSSGFPIPQSAHDCVILDSKDMSWKDERCRELHNFICSTKRVPSPPKETDPTSTSSPASSEETSVSTFNTLGSTSVDLNDTVTATLKSETLTTAVTDENPATVTELTNEETMETTVQSHNHVSQNSGKNPLSAGEIMGLTFGVTFGVAVVSIASFIFWKKQKQVSIEHQVLFSNAS